MNVSATIIYIIEHKIKLLSGLVPFSKLINNKKVIKFKFNYFGTPISKT